MTGLPQGITLERSDSANLDWPDDVLVRYRDVLIGAVWGTHRMPAGPWAAARHTATGETLDLRHNFATRDAAVRWVCLQARPVVYKVQRIAGLPIAPWEVIHPKFGSLGIFVESHEGAMSIAHALAAAPPPSPWVNA